MSCHDAVKINHRSPHIENRVAESVVDLLGDGLRENIRTIARRLNVHNHDLSKPLRLLDELDTTGRCM